MKVTLTILDKEHTINRSIQEVAVKEFQRLERYLPEASQVDLRLEHIHRARQGQTHYAHVAVAIAHEPRTFHAEAVAEDFRTALDRLFDKTAKHLRRRHNRLTDIHRRSERKEKVNRWLRATLSSPRRLLGRFGKRT